MMPYLSWLTMISLTETRIWNYSKPSKSSFTSFVKGSAKNQWKTTVAFSLFISTIQSLFFCVLSIVTQNVSYLNRRKKRSLTCLLIELFNDGCTKVYVCNKSTYLELSKSYTNSSEASIASRLLCINVILGLLFDILEFNSIRNIIFLMCLCNRKKLIY